MDFTYRNAELFSYGFMSSVYVEDSRAIPFVLATILLCWQLLHGLVKSLYGSRRVAATGQSSKSRVDHVGGKTALVFMMSRFVGSTFLFGLSSYTARRCEVRLGDLTETFRRCPELLLTITFLYTTVLSLVPLLSKSHTTWLTRHNIVLLLSAMAVYAYRDVWPLATYTETPADLAEGVLLWIKLIVLAFIAIGVPLFMPRRYVPIDPSNETPNREYTASLFSMATYAFLDHTIWLGSKVPHLGADMLEPLSDRDAAAYRTQKAFPYIDVFRGAKRRSLFWGLLRVYRKESIILAVNMALYALGGFGAPIGINRMLRYMETGGSDAKIRPWFWAMWLIFGPMTQSLTYQWYFFISTRTQIRMEGLLTQLVFEHSLRIRLQEEAAQGNGAETTTGNSSTSNSSSNGTSKGKTLSSASAEHNLAGKINNLITTDLSNVTSARDIFIMLVYVPVQMAFSVVFLYKVLGWSSLVGVAIMITLLPVPSWIAKRLQAVQREKMKRTDARVQAVSETVNILRMLKLFGWEKQTAERIDKLREEELLWLWKVKILEQLDGIAGILFPIMTMITSYALYTVVMKQTLTPSILFSSMAVFNMMNEQFNRFLGQLASTISGKVSLERIEHFLYDTELLDDFSDRPPPTLSEPSHVATDIGFKNATFSWAHKDNIDGMSMRQFKLRISGELFFKRNCINLIIGPTGSGKTSVLMALLGEMHFISSEPDSWYNLPREGGVAYAAQESWVQNDTIRNNILFQAPYDEDRYSKVVKQCALEQDLSLFEAGDATEVGERGITLSGGQKARVTLARAIYSNADILLLDDIFAALDVHTSSWIIEHCFKGDLVQGRTILLVTHNLALASPIADFIVSVGPDGKVESQGTDINAALKRNPSLQAEAEFDKEATEIEQAQSDQLSSKQQPEQKGKLVVAEEIVQGHVTWKSFMLLVKNIGGEHPVVFYAAIVLLFVIAQWGTMLRPWFLGYWGSQYEGRDPSEVNDALYIGAYAGIVFFVFLLEFSSCMSYYIGTMRASKKINGQLVDSVLRSTWRWLDQTPTARIISRCTQDMNAVDLTLPLNLLWLFYVLNGLLTRWGAVVLFAPIFILPGLGLAGFGVFLGNIYMKAQLSLKRETSNARSPLLAHFNAAMHGIVSIRAYGAQDAFKRGSLTCIDHYSRVARLSNDLNRWIAVRMDFLGALFTSGLALYLTYGTSIGASNTGFSLVVGADIAHYIVILVRVANSLEVNLNSLERIQSFIDIEHEPLSSESGQSPASWPTSGDLRVEGLSARYSEDGPKVLENISFHIASGQRVGIVGRTGSGKTSLTLALLRCILTEGSVYYDGVRTDTINLDALRTSITIIPQMPELISGTLRRNLDPLEENDDATLSNALQSAGLYSLQEEGEGGRLSLDSVISGGGANLSVGQRQIIALARAMIRGSKLLILDEATSAIDYKTDSIIQNTLRTELASDVTVITVAHRLQTIMDSDRVMVLDNGRLVELDSPQQLLKNRDGLFRSLVDGSGDRETLFELAGAAANAV